MLYSAFFRIIHFKEMKPKSLEMVLWWFLSFASRIRKFMSTVSHGNEIKFLFWFLFFLFLKFLLFFVIKNKEIIPLLGDYWHFEMMGGSNSPVYLLTTVQYFFRELIIWVVSP